MQRNEEREQARLVKWSHRAAVRALMPALRWLHHSPNGGKRDAITGGQMKALGVKPGFPDLVLPVATLTHTGLAIEMKSDTGRASTEQNEWLAHLAAQGWSVSIARSAEEGRRILCDYLGQDYTTAPALE